MADEFETTKPYLAGAIQIGEKPNNYKLYVSCGFQEVKRDTVYEKPLIPAS